MGGLTPALGIVGGLEVKQAILTTLTTILFAAVALVLIPHRILRLASLSKRRAPLEPAGDSIQMLKRCSLNPYGINPSGTPLGYSA